MDKSAGRYKRIAAWTIVLFVFYFFFGLIAVWINLITLNTYLIIGGIMGGIVSVVGLLSFFRPSMTRADIQELQLESLRDIAESTNELENLEKARMAAESDISSLELRKQQMEVLVRKASLSLFLQEQHDLYQSKVLDAVNQNKELADNLKGLSEINAKLQALDVEIKNDENVELLQEIIRDAKRKSVSKSEVTIDFGSPLLNFIFKFVELLLKPTSTILNNMFKILTK